MFLDWNFLSQCFKFYHHTELHVAKGNLPIYKQDSTQANLTQTRSHSLRQHGVGLAIQNELVEKIVEAPSFINERLLTIRFPLVKGEYAAVLSSYAPTFTSEKNLKDTFYEQLHQALSSIHKDDKIIFLLDINAWVGREASVWDEGFGRNSVVKMNRIGLRLLSLCCEFNLTIMKTIFRILDAP